MPDPGEPGTTRPADPYADYEHSLDRLERTPNPGATELFQAVIVARAVIADARTEIRRLEADNRRLRRVLDHSYADISNQTPGGEGT